MIDIGFILSFTDCVSVILYQCFIIYIITEAHRRRVRKEKLAHRDGKCHTDSDVLQRLEDIQLAEMRGHEMSRSVLFIMKC